jgi:hypothetical protein
VWKSIECIIGAAMTETPGIFSSERLVMENLMRSPTRARTTGPGTWSPKVHAENFTPGAISITLCVVSRRTSFTVAGSRGFRAASIESAEPCAKAPVWRSLETTAFEGLKSIFDTSYLSAAAFDVGSSFWHAASEATTNIDARAIGRFFIVFVPWGSGGSGSSAAAARGGPRA